MDTSYPPTGILCEMGTPGSREYYAAARAAMAAAGVTFTAIDLETGCARSVEDGDNPLNIDPRKGALIPPAMEVLLAGVCDEKFDYQPLQIDGGHADEKVLVSDALTRIGSASSQGGVVLGHNVIEADITWLAMRARALGVGRIPGVCELLAANRYNSQSRGVIDTLYLFGGNTPPVSLGKWVKFWGRKEENFGKTFGESWRAGDPALREVLVTYNKFNLTDSILLALHSGVLLSRALQADPALAAKIGGLRSEVTEVLPAGGAHGYAPRQYPSLQGEFPEFSRAGVSYITLLTAPVDGLRENGPLNAGWDEWFGRRRVKKDAADTAPFDSAYNQRMHPFLHRVIGCAWVDGATGKKGCFLNDSDERQCVLTFLELYNNLRAASTVYVRESEATKLLLLGRGSLYGLVYAPWVLADPQALRGWRSYAPWEKHAEECGVLANAVATGLLPPLTVPLADALGAYEFDPSLPPVFAGQPADQFKSEVKTHLACAYAHLRSSPALVLT